MKHFKYLLFLALALLLSIIVIMHLDDPDIGSALGDPCQTLKSAALYFILFLIISGTSFFLLVKSTGNAKVYHAYPIAYIVITIFLAWLVFEEGRYAPSSLYFLTYSCLP